MTPPRQCDRLAVYQHPRRPLMRAIYPVRVGAEPLPTMRKQGVEWPLLRVTPIDDDIPAPTRRAQEAGR